MERDNRDLYKKIKKQYKSCSDLSSGLEQDN